MMNVFICEFLLLGAFSCFTYCNKMQSQTPQKHFAAKCILIVLRPQMPMGYKR